ncbi:MAG TPA: hypothetical protein VGF99_19340 [Myxococcota bacterium]
MKTFAVTVAAALVSAAASMGSLGVAGTTNDREASVELAISADQASSVIPFIEMAAREEGLKGIRAYKNDVFIPLEQATLSFVKADGHLTMNVAVESEYRFEKGSRQAALDALKQQGNALYARALILKSQAN